MYPLNNTIIIEVRATQSTHDIAEGCICTHTNISQHMTGWTKHTFLLPFYPLVVRQRAHRYLASQGQAYPIQGRPVNLVFNEA